MLISNYLKQQLVVKYIIHVNKYLSSNNNLLLSILYMLISNYPQTTISCSVYYTC